jgi:hypothetical protein
MPKRSINLHKFTFSILLSTSILFSNELVDALKGIKPQNRAVETISNSIKPTECDKSIVDAIIDNNLQFFRTKKREPQRDKQLPDCGRYYAAYDGCI